MLINELCKKNRIILDLTIEEFALSMGVDSNLYRKFEEGIYAFPNEIMRAIINSLYIEKEDLLEAESDDEILNISMKAIEACED